MPGIPPRGQTTVSRPHYQPCSILVGPSLGLPFLPRTNKHRVPPQFTLQHIASFSSSSELFDRPPAPFWWFPGILAPRFPGVWRNIRDTVQRSSAAARPRPVRERTREIKPGQMEEIVKDFFKG